MTVREVIATRKRKASIVAYSGFALFALGMVLDGGEPWFSVALPGFAVFFAATVYLLLFLRCPACRGSIGYTVNHPSGPFSVSRKIRFCPFCGIPLDSELGSTGSG